MFRYSNFALVFAQALRQPYFTNCHPRLTTGLTITRLTVSSCVIASFSWRCRNLHLLSIDYACRPRLRSRLTLGGLTCPRNPWSSGGQVSHLSFATHACILTPTPSTPGSLRRFHGCRTLPYPPTPLHTPPQGCADDLCECRGFGGVLEPRYIVGAEFLD